MSAVFQLSLLAGRGDESVLSRTMEGNAIYNKIGDTKRPEVTDAKY